MYFPLVGKISVLLAFSFCDETAGGDSDEVDRKLIFAADTAAEEPDKVPASHACSASPHLICSVHEFHHFGPLVPA